MAKQITVSNRTKTWHVSVADRTLASAERYNNYMQSYAHGVAGRMVMQQWLNEKRITEADLCHQDGRPDAELIPSASQALKDEFNAAIQAAVESISYPPYEEAASTH